MDVFCLDGLLETLIGFRSKRLQWLRFTVDLDEIDKVADELLSCYDWLSNTKRT